MIARHKTNRHLLLHALFFNLSVAFLLTPTTHHGQCNSPDVMPGLICEDAPLICLQNWCAASQNLPVAGYTGFCGPNTVVHNPQYYAFIPVLPDVIITIHVDDCDTGMGLQSAIITSCPWTIGDVVSCDPGTPPGASMYLQVSGLDIGVVHWLLIDGSAGSICSYTITETYGIYAPPVTGDLSGIQASPTILQQGQEVLLTVSPSVEGAHGYYWVNDWSTDTITSTSPSLNMDIPCALAPGTYTICARAFSGCDTTDTDVCTTIEVIELIDTIIKPTAIFCPEQFPIPWHNEMIHEPGTYTQTFLLPSGCTRDTIWQVDAYPASGMAIVDTLICQLEFSYEGQVYDASGVYDLIYPGQSMYGCDSLAELHLMLHGLNFFVESSCLDSAQTLGVHILEHSFPQDSIFYSWYDCSLDSLLSSSRAFYPDTSGCFGLVLDHGFCHDTLYSDYQPDPCATVCALTEEISCTGDTVLFSYDGPLSDDATLHWLIDRPGFDQPLYSGLDALLISYAVPGCYRASLTIVDSNTTRTCVDSFCVEVPLSTASVCCTEIKCDSCTTLLLEFAGEAPWTLLLTTGAETDTISGIVTTSYSYLVCPPADSMITYSIQVMDAVSPCPASIQGDHPVHITLHSDPLASILQTGDILCAEQNDAYSYHWFYCGPGASLATTSCYQATFPGCYCVEVTNAYGCRDTACYEYVINSSTGAQPSVLSISPVPSNGTWQIEFPENIKMPLSWSLYSPMGGEIESGIITDQKSLLQLQSSPGQGLYYLQFYSGSDQIITSKVMIQPD